MSTNGKGKFFLSCYCPFVVEFSNSGCDVKNIVEIINGRHAHVTIFSQLASVSAQFFLLNHCMNRSDESP